jgi:hypothetical protein
LRGGIYTGLAGCLGDAQLEFLRLVFNLLIKYEARQNAIHALLQSNEEHAFRRTLFVPFRQPADVPPG